MKHYLQVVTLVLFFSQLFGWQTVYGEVKSLSVDKAHSNIYFSIDHIFSKINGRFDDFEAEIRFDPADLEGSRFYFKIMVDSIDTNIAKRDKHLLSSDFFDAGKYPEMTFESVSITDMGDSRFDVLGKLTVKGQVYDFVLPLVFAGVKDHPAISGKKVAGFNGTVTLDRLAYRVGGGKFYDMGIIGKDVDVLVSLEALSR
ncbi:YceI family protein [Desulforhopalus singaporensis]|uniref:Polyisoprenoid-binding protein YceI n=1 Tax=Desulforhopalus singaporensis TaxID=91360 RepID=A0A1H0L318_9BACT|nr:YceI family protein [Desulforhopalus singaporensis]SDO62442.1 Polyisoprenoid-binding protein YceI [Desulforhopalus singaporensis]